MVSGSLNRKSIMQSAWQFAIFSNEIACSEGVSAVLPSEILNLQRRLRGRFDYVPGKSLAYATLKEKTPFGVLKCSLAAAVCWS